MTHIGSSRHTRSIGAATVVAAAVLGTGLPAQAAATPAQKVPLTDINRDCTGAVVPGGPDTGTFGFAVVTKPASGKLVVTVALKDAHPDTTYDVRLIQLLPDQSDCHTIDGTLTTDDSGDGSTNVHEPALPGAGSMFVVLNNHTDFTQFYVTAPVTF